ncbi:hypothetical protein D3C73_1380340 [compost metagenome]
MPQALKEEYHEGFDAAGPGGAAAGGQRIVCAVGSAVGNLSERLFVEEPSGFRHDRMVHRRPAACPGPELLGGGQMGERA